MRAARNANATRNTVFARPAATLGVESHNGSLWFCAIAHGSSQLLAKFESEEAAATYQRLQAARDAFAREVGRTGI